MQSIDDLAREITALDPSEQQALIERVAQLNFQKGCTNFPRNIEAAWRLRAASTFQPSKSGLSIASAKR